jgi:RNA polymerase sigma-70 factor (ECF subfamily)
MNARLRKSTKQAVGTLGGLLYTDRSRPRIPEKDWVELVRGIGAGDVRALGTLYMWTHGIVFAAAMRIAKNRARAEDITVAVFHDVWRGASQFDGEHRTVMAWIMNLARTRALQACEAPGR